MNLLCSKQPAISVCYEPTKTIDTLPFYFNAHLNIILPSTPRSSKWSLTFTFSHHNFVDISLSPQCMLHAPII